MNFYSTGFIALGVGSCLLVAIHVQARAWHVNPLVIETVLRPFLTSLLTVSSPYHGVRQVYPGGAGRAPFYIPSYPEGSLFRLRLSIKSGASG